MISVPEIGKQTNKYCPFNVAATAITQILILFFNNNRPVEDKVNPGNIVLICNKCSFWNTDKAECLLETLKKSLRTLK